MLGGVAVNCTICPRPDRASIDKALATGSESIRAMARRLEVNHQALGRHRKHVARALVRAADKRHGLAEIGIANEVDRLRAEAERLGAAAKEKGDLRTALVAIRELTRLSELQSRLTLEAREARAEDISNHPVMHEFIALILSALNDCATCKARMLSICADKLGTMTVQ